MNAWKRWGLLGLALSATLSPLSAETTVTGLQCEYAVDPKGIDLTAPRLFWRLESDRRGARQTAWQVLVASSPERLARNQGDLWDTGRVEGAQATHVHYAGQPLAASQTAYWKVRSWDETGTALPWSAPAQWTMGQLDPSDWQGTWIQAPEESSVLLFRRGFTVRPGLSRALLHVTGLGHYEASLNGKKIGDAVLSPGWTNYAVSALYDTHEVTAQLVSGENVLGLVVGDGMYHVYRPEGRFSKFVRSFGAKRLIADLRLEYADGSVEVIASDDAWKTAPSATTFSGAYGGVDHDARLEQPGWDRPGFDDRAWATAVPATVPEGAELRGHRAASNPLGHIERRDPVAVIPLSAEGAVTFDLGQNTAYMPRFRVRGPAGSRVRIIPGELIYADGFVSRTSMGGAYRGSSWWEYIKATDEEEEWTPKFHYNGSRYFQTQAYPAEEGGALPEVVSLEGFVTHSTAKPVGGFATSNPLINDIRGLVRWAQRSNMVSVLTDCPHREKLGWLEQYHLNGPSIRYEFDMARMYTKGMQDMADSQTTDGLIPNIAPEYTQFRGNFRAAAEWGAAFIQVPWQQYQFLGDTLLFERHYPAMKEYFDYLESRLQEGLLSEGLGDWVDLGPRRLNRSELTAIPVTATAFFYQNAVVLAEIATLLGHPADAERFRAAAEATRERFNAAFFDPETRSYGPESQTGNALALVFGLAEESERAAVMEALLADLDRRDGAMSAGDVGFRFLIQALAEGGQHEAICRMITRTEAPGYAFILSQGATSLTESWEAIRSSSQNHFMLGHIMEWFYGDLLGIAPDPTAPGFEEFLVRPQPVGDLRWAEGGHETLFGRIDVRWERKSDGFSLHVTVPANTTATVHVPLALGASVFESGLPVEEAPGVRFLRHEDGRAVYAVASGNHHFVTRR